MIAVSCVLIIFLSTVGLFNNCWCWSVYMTRQELAVVPLNTETTYEDRATDTYSAIVAASIGAQVLFFLSVTWHWRHGLGLVHWHEKDRRREWAHESDDKVLWYPKSFLLFWYNEEELEEQEMKRQRRAGAFQSLRRPTLIESTFRRPTGRWSGMSGLHGEPAARVWWFRSGFWNAGHVSPSCMFVCRQSVRYLRSIHL